LQRCGLKLLSLVQQASMLKHNQCLALIGNGNTDFWPVFSSSKEFSDGCCNPLDRWSQRLASQLAQQFEAQIIYPFTGPPYHPFLTWAQTNGDSFASPLGLHFHRQYGLWHGYRFALIVTRNQLIPSDFSSAKNLTHPCTDCAQPCMHSCPVNAFSASGYDVASCRSYVRQNPQASCATNGCAARLACPLSPPGGYETAQQQYHMAVFARQG